MVPGGSRGDYSFPLSGKLTSHRGIVTDHNSFIFCKNYEYLLLIYPRKIIGSSLPVINLKINAVSSQSLSIFFAKNMAFSILTSGNYRGVWSAVPRFNPVSEALVPASRNS